MVLTLVQWSLKIKSCKPETFPNEHHYFNEAFSYMIPPLVTIHSYKLLGGDREHFDKHNNAQQKVHRLRWKFLYCRESTTVKLCEGSCAIREARLHQPQCREEPPQPSHLHKATCC